MSIFITSSNFTSFFEAFLISLNFLVFLSVKRKQKHCHNKNFTCVINHFHESPVTQNISFFTI